jgi:NADP-reducing hydrogenase subunit HndB
MMDKINSLDDLRKIKQQAADGMVQIKVAMATCSIASGARETMEAFLEKIEKENLKAVVTQTGCMGYCFAEPTVEVHQPGQAPVVFAHVDAQKVEQIVDRYIKKGEPVNGIVPVNYQTIHSEDTDSSHKQLRIALRNCGFFDPEKINDI